jgi:hypothetical protein
MLFTAYRRNMHPLGDRMSEPSYPLAFARVNYFCARPFQVEFENSRGISDSTDTTLKTLGL